MTKRSPVRLRLGVLSGNDSGQVIHTHVPLSPSSIIYYRSKGGDAGSVTAGLVESRLMAAYHGVYDCHLRADCL